MRLKKAKKRITPQPLKLKPKRLDLNEHQISLQRKISEISTEDLISLEGEIHRTFPQGTLSSPIYFRKGLRYYFPEDVQSVTGLSKKTLEKYIEGYLRVVRRQEESSEDFSKRKKLVDRPDAPVVKNVSEEDPSKDFRLISSRILIFLILAPAQVKGDKPNLRHLRKLLSESSTLQKGSPKPIHRNSSVTTWSVS